MGESAGDPLPHRFERTTVELLTVSLIGGNTSSDGIGCATWTLVA